MAAAALPEEVLAAVLALLSPPELARAACVCRSWCVAAASSVLWQAAFLRTFEPAEAAELVRRAAPGAPDWRAALAERYRAGAGWRDGRCRTYTLKAANRLGDLFCISDDHLICCNEDGSIDVRCLERRAGGQRRPTRVLNAHASYFSACDADEATGLVLTAAEDGTAALWRSAAAMAAHGAGALLGRCVHERPVTEAWILSPSHLALVLCILGGDDADAPPQRCTATLWEFPLPDDADAPASATALPPPRLAATWTDVFASPPRPAGDARLSTNVSPTMCFMSASQPCVTPEGAIALRDVATGDVAALRGAEDINVASLRNVVVDARPGGARHVLLESRTQQFTLLDADSGALLKAFSLPQTQMPLMYIDSPAWVSAPTRYLITGQAVLLPPDGNDTRCLTSATRSDGRSIPAATARAAAAAARAHAAAAPHDPWGPPPAPKVAIYRLFSCISGALQSRIVLPLNIPVREDAPFQFNGQFISSDWVCPGADVISTLLWEPGAGGTARVLLSRNGDCAPAIPLPAVFVQRHPDMPQADGGLPPFSFSVADAATWRWVVLSDTVHAEGAPGGASAALHHELTPPADARCGAADITVLDFLPRA